ncbi:MAG: nuclear transport factor 2 family protein [Emticicia sp.]|uniref:nuclear transport factor 2 family protein n=1 Tax=Emticicia sp. TaxID=1930953 RepID=UPI003BA71685
MTTLNTVKNYYDCFNNKDWQGMLALVHPEIKHQPNQGEERIGKELFADFLKMMDECYEETLTEIVLLSEPTNNRVAAEFVVNGIYKKGDEDSPAAHGQKYVLPAGAFLEVKDGLITRVTTYYNLPLWIKLVS